ncbi:glycosyltransferase family A protein [Salinimicrobium sp. TIG7-5_MAKvit]|uniref:glycosyltransferase family 2 protein n=1 Tax=Salinimicrobium sp. TIG7-5_MAKvit TaxID=3121289 RepID=UPI003C6E944A
MRHQYIISVILPTYNRSSSLLKAVDSVRNQSNPHWRLIIVDDGSTDDTRELIDELLDDARISYVYTENAGVSAARNKGLELSNTDYVIFLDSDDYFLPNLFQQLLDEKFFNFDLICWWAIKENEEKRKIWKPVKLENIYNYRIASFLAGSVCYRRDLLLKAGGFDANLEFGENYELGMRICQYPINIKLIKQTFLVVKSKLRTNDSIPQRLHSCIYQYKKHRNLFKKDRLSESRIFYMIAHFLEKTSKKRSSSNFYLRSWQSNPWNIKAFLKILQSKFQRAV